MRVAVRMGLLGAAVMLGACSGSQTGKGLNAFDSKSFWNSDYSDYYTNDSFYYSGYSEEQVHKASLSNGWYGDKSSGDDSN